MKRERSVTERDGHTLTGRFRTDGMDKEPSTTAGAQKGALEAQERACPDTRRSPLEAGARLGVPALVLALAVEAAEARRRQAEWLAQRLASFGHSPTRKDGRELDCGHAFCRNGCAYCWLDVSEKAAGRIAGRRTRGGGRGKAQ